MRHRGHDQGADTEFPPAAGFLGNGAKNLLSSTEATIAKALKHLHSNPLFALGENMEAARTALALLKANPDDPVALHDYNFAVSRMVGSSRPGSWTPGQSRSRFPPGAESSC